MLKNAIPFSGGIFPTQGLNPGLLHGRRILHHLIHQGSLIQASINMYCAIYPRANPFPFLPVPSTSHVVMNI